MGITPAAGFVAPWAAAIIGAVAGVLCYAAVVIKDRLRYDDSLDAFGVHGVGGAAGALLTGVFASTALNAAGRDGLLYGNAAQVGLQLAGIAAVGIYAAVMTWVVLKVLDKLMGLRVPEQNEREGLDSTEHGETGYAL